MPLVIPAPWKEFSTRLMKVRTEVFVREQGVPASIEHDEWDEKSFHVLLIDGDEDLGTGRLLPTGYIGRVCVLKSRRGQGLGQLVMDSLIEEARRRSMKEVILSSQVQALEFYEKLGFAAFSDEYMEAGIPHRKMKLEFNV